MTENNIYFAGAKTLTFTPLGATCSGQDGAIWGGCLFRFNAKGLCRVYAPETLTQIGEFTLDKADVLVPHSNAVSFGSEFFAEGDEFPILYTNIYNNIPLTKTGWKGSAAPTGSPGRTARFLLSSCRCFG